MTRSTKSSDSEKTTADDTAEETPRKPVGIKYVGTADVKHLNAADMGYSTEEIRGLEWSSQNDYTAQVEDMDGSALEYLRTQPDFRVVYG